jgi:tRNA(Ile)-lysidine synthase
MGFSQDRLLEIISTLPAASRYWVAYSGGMDSHVLLHALSVLAPRLDVSLQAIHVHHGLQEEADQWSERCTDFCRERQVPISVVRISAVSEKGESPEAAARDARYRALSQQMETGDILFTAHHQDDQAETVLLQLLRGSGPSGLAAMTGLMEFAPGYLARPLLEFPREQLAAYAQEQGLTWVEDASNRDTSFDRNFLRQRVMPVLKERWPALGRTFSRSARHCGEAQQLIDTLANQALAGLLDANGNGLDLDGLAALPSAEARAVLRAWIRSSGHTLPDTARLDRILTEVAPAGEDRNPLIHWPDVELRRFRGRLYLRSPQPELDPALVLDWDGKSPLELPAGVGRLHPEQGLGGISPEYWTAGSIQIRFRAGGERCRPAARGKSRELKKLLQEFDIPPWERERIPLITIDGRLAAVGDLLLCEPFTAGEGEQGVRLRWERT